MVGTGSAFIIFLKILRFINAVHKSHFIVTNPWGRIVFVNINFTLDSLQDFSLWFVLPVESRLQNKEGFDMNSSLLKFGNQSAQAARRNQQNNFIQTPKAFSQISHKCQLFLRHILEILGEFLPDFCFAFFSFKEILSWYLEDTIGLVRRTFSKGVT